MASINWFKIGLDYNNAGYTRHFDNNSRTKSKHSNKEINTSLTKLNYNIGPDWKTSKAQFARKLSAIDSIEKYRPKRFKKDRKVLTMLTWVCPKELIHIADYFFRFINDKLKEFFGFDCFGDSLVLSSFIHKDEVHSYKDARTHEDKESLFHAHTLVVPFTEEKGINMYNFSNKDRIKSLNDFIHNAILEEFGVSYNLGYSGDYKSVEELKDQSRLLEKNSVDIDIEESRLNIYEDYLRNCF